MLNCIIYNIYVILKNLSIVISSMKRDNFISSCPIWMPFLSFSCQVIDQVKLPP